MTVRPPSGRHLDLDDHASVTPADCFPVFTNTWRMYIHNSSPSTLLQPELQWSVYYLTIFYDKIAPHPVDICISTTTRPLTSQIGSLCSQAPCGFVFRFTVHQSSYNPSCSGPTTCTHQSGYTSPCTVYPLGNPTGTLGDPW